MDRISSRMTDFIVNIQIFLDGNAVLKGDKLQRCQSTETFRDVFRDVLEKCRMMNLIKKDYSNYPFNESQPAVSVQSTKFNDNVRYVDFGETLDIARSVLSHESANLVFSFQPCQEEDVNHVKVLVIETQPLPNAFELLLSARNKTRKLPPIADPNTPRKVLTNDIITMLQCNSANGILKPGQLPKSAYQYLKLLTSVFFDLDHRLDTIISCGMRHLNQKG